jgi:hypothetical protein
VIDVAVHTARRDLASPSANDDRSPKRAVSYLLSLSPSPPVYFLPVPFPDFTRVPREIRTLHEQAQSKSDTSSSSPQRQNRGDPSRNNLPPLLLLLPPRRFTATFYSEIDRDARASRSPRYSSPFFEPL